MIEILKYKLCLIFICLMFKFRAYEIHGGKNPAPKVRLFYFKSDLLNNCQDAAFREGVGVSVILIHILAFFVCINITEFKMNCSIFSRRKSLSSSQILSNKLAVLSLAIETAVSKIAELQGPESDLIKGTRIAFNEFQTELERYQLKSFIYPHNEQKIIEASRKLDYDYNTLLNSVLDCVNIIPRTECAS